MINVRVNILACSGKQQELLQSISRLKDMIAAETGCASCHIYQNSENPDEFIVFEQWKNEEQAYTHLDSENLAVLVGAGSVLSHDIRVTITKEPSTPFLEKIFNDRIIKKEK